MNPAPKQPSRSGNPPRAPAPTRQPQPGGRVCPVCGGALEEIRAKLQCRRCHTIVETCCEGGPQ